MGDAVIYISSSVSYSSMPLNEFCLYRSKHYKDTMHYYLSYKNSDRKVVESIEGELKKDGINNVKILEAGGSVIKLITILRKTLNHLGKKNNIVVHSHHPLSAVFAGIYLKVFTTKLFKIYTVHNTYKNFKFIHKLFTNVNVIMYDKVVFCGRSSYEGYPFNKIFKKTTFISNGVNLEKINSVKNNRPNKTKKDSIEVVTFSKSNGQKNIKFLLNVFKDLSVDIHLNIIGDLSSSAKAMYDDLQLSNVFHHGRMPRSKVLELLIHCDLFISSSNYEGLPVGVLEAMGIGKPVILSNIESHRELDYSENSIVVLDLDKSNWLSKINELSNLGNSHRMELGNKNSKIVQNNFSLKKMHEKYNKVYFS